MVKELEGSEDIKMKITSINQQIIDTGNKKEHKSNLTSPDRVIIGASKDDMTDIWKMQDMAKSTVSGFEEHLLSKEQEQFQSLVPQDVHADVKTIPVGAGLYWANRALGSNIYIHEMLGHQLTDSILRDGFQGYIQGDSIDNMKSFVTNPSVETLKNLITEYDVGGDHCKGYAATVSMGTPSEIGSHFTEDQRQALSFASGCIAESLPTFLGFTAGFKLRKKHPLLGYSLMSFGAINHFRTSLYVASAMLPEVQAMGGGHDWTNFAKLTGINPAISTFVFASTLPLLAIGLYMMEKGKENVVKDGVAMARLIEKGKISQDDLEKAFAGYDRKDLIIKAEEKVEALLNTAEDKKKVSNSSEFKKALKELEHEYKSFSDNLSGKYRELIAEERKIIDSEIPRMSLLQSLENTKNTIKKEWNADKVGLTLGAGVLASNGAALIAGALKTVLDVFCAQRGITPQNMTEGIGNLITGANQSLGNILSAALPAAGILTLLFSSYKAVKTFKNPESDKLDKAMAAGSAMCSAIGASGMLFPALALPLAIVALTGHLSLWAGRKLLEQNK